VQSLSDFDSWPDLLNVGNGVLDLQTGDLQPHDPDFMLTKLAPVDFKPGATHPDWEAALGAIPDDVRDWFQIRLGQGITGYIPDDDMMIVMQGGGENGKNTVMEAISKTLGDYHLFVDHRALLGSVDQIPTEVAEFRGARLAWLDELPEGRYLPTVRLKKLTSGQISARRMARDPMKFDASHSIFVSTNYLPAVSETDEGTWRRLALLKWPFRYRKPGQPIRLAYERRGDPGLRYRLRRGKKQHEAILAWLAEGARRWYENDMRMPPLPKRVLDDSELWRMDSDSILGFIREEMEFDAPAHVMSADLYRQFNVWLQTKQQRPWSDKTFFDRWAGHHEITANSIVRKKVRYSPKSDPSRPVGAAGGVPASYQAWFGIRFRPAYSETVPSVPASPDGMESSKPLF
jgi:putative DNA primase/helicase